MRTKAHYAKLFKSAETVDPQLLARGIYAARYGYVLQGEDIADELNQIIEEVDLKTMTGEEAVTLLNKEKHWRDSLTEDPIPSWSLQAALDYLVTNEKIPSERRSRGQSWLARKAGVDSSTVRRWISGSLRLTGTSARLVRLILKETE